LWKYLHEEDESDIIWKRRVGKDIESGKDLSIGKLGFVQVRQCIGYILGCLIQILGSPDAFILKFKLNRLNIRFGMSDHATWWFPGYLLIYPLWKILKISLLE
jgi:hypothetical protein